MRRHKGSDGWGRDSYDIPTYAVAGSSDCGSFSDSPAPTTKVLAELEGVIAFLKAQGVQADFWRPDGEDIGATESGNIFMGKRWVVVPAKQFKLGTELADEWLDSHKRDTYYIHDAT